MKMSELTAENVATYLRETYSSMTVSEVAELTAMVAAAKAYVKGFTGLEDVSPVDEVVGTGDGEETEFTVAYRPASGQTVCVDDVTKTETTDYTFVDATGVITFINAPADGAEITASYSAVPSDAFEDLAIAAKVLCQDMYDRREYHVDKSNVNLVVDAILGMHRVNLL